MKILITTANGMFGNAVAKSLLEKGYNVRAMVRDVNKFDYKHSNLEVVRGDLDIPESLHEVMKGVSSVFLSTPMHPKIKEREINIINTAKEHNVKHIVKIYGSVRHEKDKLDTMHSYALEYLKGSGIKWTLVSPNSVMETSLLPYAESIRTEHAIFGMSGYGKIGLVALKDVAKVSSIVLTTEGVYEKNFELTGPKALNLFEVSDIFSKVLGRKIEYIDFPESEFLALMKKEMGMTDLEIELNILCHLRAWKNGKAELETDTFQILTGGEPTSLEAFIKENINKFT
ncbi:NAD(P)H-binding protein [Bacteroidota bacterium]